jgi:hypothetical protein
MIKEAKKILGNKASLFSIIEYKCNKEYCGHEDSIILSANENYIPVCYDLNQLKIEFKKVKNLSDEQILNYLLVKKV